MALKCIGYKDIVKIQHKMKKIQATTGHLTLTYGQLPVDA